MCCRTEVTPLDDTIARVILAVGNFHPQGDPAVAVTWRREVPEESCYVTVSLTGGRFEASIQPSVSSYDHHHGKRITAGLYFEICAKYAEKVGGLMVQKANVLGCKDTAESVSQLVLAHYPDEPLLWERACRGFQEVILGEALQ